MGRGDRASAGTLVRAQALSGSVFILDYLGDESAEFFAARMLHLYNFEGAANAAPAQTRKNLVALVIE